MSTHLNHRLLRMSLFLVFGAFMLAVSGCGSERTPIAASQEQLVPNPQGPSYLVLSGEAFERAGKKIKNQGKKIRDTFSHKGGELEIVEEDKDLDAKMEIKFKVKKGALPEDAETEIEMMIFGDYASEMVIGFTPSGIVFEKDCELEIKIKGAWVDLSEEQIEALHFSSYGEVENAEIKKIDVKDDELTIKIKIPGFSRYSMGGGQ